MMAIQMTLSVSAFRSLHGHMEKIVNEKLVKNNLAQTMLDTSRERGILIMQIYFEDDPFERDELAIQFSSRAGEFMAARNRLLAMRLSEKESSALNHALEQSKQGTQAFNQVLRLVMAEEGMTEVQRSEAQKIFSNTVIPARKIVGESMNRILHLVEVSSQQAITTSEQEYQRTLQLLWALGIGFFLVASAVTWIIYQRISRAAEKICFITNQMKSQIRETVTMFNVSVALIEHSMLGGDQNMREMIDQLTQRSRMIREIRQHTERLREESSAPDSDHSLEEYDRLDETINSAIMAFQDFDRVSQQLVQVENCLNATAELINDPERIHDLEEWKKMHQRMNNTFAMEDAQIVYQEMLGGASKQEALQKAQKAKEQSGDQFEAF